MRKILLFAIISTQIYHISAQIKLSEYRSTNIDSKSRDIIFNGTWKIDSILTKHFLNYTIESYDQEIVYNFNKNSILTCFKGNQQSLDCAWKYVDSSGIILTFNAEDESSRWVFWQVSKNKLIVRNYLPAEPKNKEGDPPDFKYTKQLFILTRVKDASCN